MVAVLQQATVQVAGSQKVGTVNRIQLRYPMTESPQQKPVQDHYDRMIQAINYHWFWLFIGSMITATLFWILFKQVSNCYCRLQEMRITTTLAIQFCRAR